MKKNIKILLTTTLTIVLLLGFALPLNPPNGFWYQQFLPNLNGRTISDITFIDSLTGWAVTGNETPNDTNYILKTTNSGNNWAIVFSAYRDFSRIHFINQTTGYTCGGFNVTQPALYKTTDGGLNWFPINLPFVGIKLDDMVILSEDTIWITDKDALFGGVHRTTNGGTNWTPQYSSGSLNPNKIYFYNARLGFISNQTGTNFNRTTDGGQTWQPVTGAGGFTDMYFADSLTGWKAFGDMKKTTNGGLNWVQQVLPSGGLIQSNNFIRISAVNRDTIWGVGGYLFYGSGRDRGIIFKTTNGGSNWGYQLPDTSYGIPQFLFINFIDKNKGWAYSSFFNYQAGHIVTNGVHTILGGDTLTYMRLNELSAEVPSGYLLLQNYPNPFNPKTTIEYAIKKAVYIRISVHDLTGKHIIDLVNRKQQAGIYTVYFNGSGLSSGVYFYSLYAEGKIISTKKMLLVK